MGYKIWKKTIFFCLFNNKICLKYSLLYGAGIDISYIEDTHQILFGSANSFESYCAHMKSQHTYVHPDRQTDRQTDGRKFFSVVLSFNIYKTWTFIKRREFFVSTHAITILFLFTYSVCDEKVNKKISRVIWM